MNRDVYDNVVTVKEKLLGNCSKVEAQTFPKLDAKFFPSKQFSIS